jgi:hypothetical protein
VLGDSGEPNKDSFKHIYGGKIEISGSGKAIAGNVSEPGFANKFLND